MRLLNNTQTEKLKELILFYKYFYICNHCGSVYGSDYKEVRGIICPVCAAKLKHNNKKMKGAIKI